MLKLLQLVIILPFILPLWVKAQDSTAAGPHGDSVANCYTMDATDYIRKWFHLKNKPSENASSFFIAPVFGSTPSTGFLFGIALFTCEIKTLIQSISCKWNKSILLRSATKRNQKQ